MGSKIGNRTLHADLDYDANYDNALHPSVVIGKMDKLCMYCSALKFKNETPGMCWTGEKVKLQELHPPPEPISTLVSGGTSQSKHFSANIRKYNYMPTFEVQGQIYHRAGLPLPDAEHKCLQTYFMETLMNKSIIIVPIIVSNRT